MTDFFPRHLAPSLRRATEQFPAVVLTGPRQSGKTCLLRHEFAVTHRYVALDDPNVRRFVEDDPRGFLEDHPPPLLLDEVQQVPALLPWIKLAIDADRDACGRFLLTGSQTFALMRGVTESLAGRAAVLQLLPLAVGENPERRVGPVVDRESYTAWCLTGSFPELHRRPQLDASMWYGAYLQSYLERDVRTEAGVGNLRDFNRLVALLAARSSAILNLSANARELGVAVNTVKAWVSILEASGQVYLCPAYYESFGKRLIKSPRVHMLDAGMLCRLTGTTTSEQALHGPLAGPLFESFVGGELLRLMTNAARPPRLYHWRTVSGAEVDFVVETGGRVHGIECKLTASPTRRHTRGLRSLREALPESRRGASLLLCTAPEGGRLGDARVVPLRRLHQVRSIGELVGDPGA